MELHLNIDGSTWLCQVKFLIDSNVEHLQHTKPDQQLVTILRITNKIMWIQREINSKKQIFGSWQIRRIEVKT